MFGEGEAVVEPLPVPVSEDCAMEERLGNLARHALAGEHLKGASSVCSLKVKEQEGTK